MNDGLRPHLSKWHLPLSKWIENKQKVHPDETILQIEKRLPQRKESIAYLKEMNGKMQNYSEKLLEIVKARQAPKAPYLDIVFLFIF